MRASKTKKRVQARRLKPQESCELESISWITDTVIINGSSMTVIFPPEKLKID